MFKLVVLTFALLSSAFSACSMENLSSGEAKEHVVGVKMAAYQTESDFKQIWDLRFANDNASNKKIKFLMDEVDSALSFRATTIRAAYHLNKKMPYYDPEYAVAILLNDSEKGNNRSKAFLGWLLEHQIDIGISVAASIKMKDKKINGKDLINIAAARNDGLALSLLASDCGKNVPSNCSEVEFLEQTKKAANVGYAPAYSNLSAFYLQKENIESSRMYAYKARELGDPEGSWRLVQNYIYQSRLNNLSETESKNSMSLALEAAYGCVNEAEQFVTDYYLSLPTYELASNREAIAYWTAISYARHKSWALRLSTLIKYNPSINSVSEAQKALSCKSYLYF